MRRAPHAGLLVVTGLLITNPRAVESQLGNNAEIAASVYPVFVECLGEWLDTDNVAVVLPGQNWDVRNHFDGHHATPPSGLDDFESCMHQCIGRDACVMLHYINHVSTTRTSAVLCQPCRPLTLRAATAAAVVRMRPALGWPGRSEGGETRGDRRIQHRRLHSGRV